MLQLKQICKQYKTGELVQEALNGVSLNFRDNEFVSILGPSGSGKTTLLNIIGGLDRYDSGELIINGVSTKKYKDRDWDSYRNHTIGFVFQSYNLIPHQSVLSNVELALTISGISRAERRERAKKALEEVGLGDQLHKKPNQMSGGQMQRVAIARALVNDPDILLADEPTGALDTETSIQVMELLKKVADKRLVVMVTHNPELAEQYSTRIVKLRDGEIIDDSDPYQPDAIQREPEHKNMGKAKMSFLTSLSLSFNNLRTKRGRTFLTSLAGSIGIIGIALILALSNGVNGYISSIQKDTMTSYPITISSSTIDMSSMMEMRSQMMSSRLDNEVEEETRTSVYADFSEVETSDLMITTNNLTDFKKYLDDPESDIQQYIGENGVVYTYNANFSVYSYDKDGNLVNSDADIEETSGSTMSGFAAMRSNMSGGGMMGGGMPAMMNSALSGSTGAENFSELMASTDGSAVSRVITDSYDVLYGEWPTAYNEVVLVLNDDNSVSVETLYQLGLISADEYKEAIDQVDEGTEPKDISFEYSDVCEHVLYMVPACDHYIENEDGTFSNISESTLEADKLLENATELTITGVIRPKSDAANATISTAIGYTSLLTDYVIEHTNSSPVITAQEADPETNVLTGMEFSAADDAAKIADAKEYAANLGISDKASLYTMIRFYNQSNTEEADNDETGNPGAAEMNPGNAAQQSGPQMGSTTMDETSMAAALDYWLEETPDDEILIAIYDEHIAGSTYEDNLKSFGKVSYDAPDSISIYTDSFESKEAVSDCIAAYNKTASEDNQISYTDYVELMTSSLTSIIDVISYVLIAFVAVSLIVSCIMIGIITHISVLERTKEIGILRAIGASKRNISQVFNAETFIIGCCSGLLGVGISALLTVPINAVIGRVLGAADLIVTLPVASAIILVVISIVITVVGGLWPSRNAAKKDPVIALRAE